jgi:uncharacterized membrane protein
MSSKAAITVLRPLDEVQRLWESPDYHPEEIGSDAKVTFGNAPGDRGTEIYVEVQEEAPGGKIGEVVQKIAGAVPRAKAQDGLRRFKQRVETGEIARSDGSPEGELAERKLKQRPAQPLEQSELEKVGV